MRRPRYLEPLVMIIGDCNICEPEEGRFNVRNRPSQKVTRGKQLFSGLISRMSLTSRTLSRIDRAFINLPMAEARDFRCSSHISDNLGERFIPSDHVAVRVVTCRDTKTDNLV